MKASTLLRLSDGTVATLAEHLDVGRMVVDPEPCRGSRGGVAYTASEVGTTKVVTIGKTLWQSRTRAANGPVTGVKWDGHGADEVPPRPTLLEEAERLLSYWEQHGDNPATVAKWAVQDMLGILRFIVEEHQ